jgi:hypothetical protein
LIDALAEPNDFRKIVQDPEPAGISDFRDQAEDRVGTDIEKCAAARAHETATVSVLEGIRPVAPAQAVRSASARRDIIYFLALPRSRFASGGIKPKFTFIG